MLTPSPKMSPSSSDDVALVDADAQLRALIRRHAGIAPGHAGACTSTAQPWCIDDAGEFDQQPVPGGLENPPVMQGDSRIDQFGADRLQPIERPLLITPISRGIAHDIGSRDHQRGGG